MAEQERLTARDPAGNAYFPECFKEPCGGGGCTKDHCEFFDQVCDKLAGYEEQGEQVEKQLTESETTRADLGKRLAAAQQEMAEVKAAEQAGRLVVLPFKSHSTMLDSSDVANPMLMNDVRLAVMWSSSSRILFYTPLDHFLRDMQEGKICLLEERHCNKCEYWIENDPRCMCSESQWAGRTVKANNYCSRFIRRRGRDA